MAFHCLPTVLLLVFGEIFLPPSPLVASRGVIILLLLSLRVFLINSLFLRSGSPPSESSTSCLSVCWRFNWPRADLMNLLNLMSKNCYSVVVADEAIKRRQRHKGSLSSPSVFVGGINGESSSSPSWSWQWPLVLCMWVRSANLVN